MIIFGFIRLCGGGAGVLPAGGPSGAAAGREPCIQRGTCRSGRHIPASDLPGALSPSAGVKSGYKEEPQASLDVGVCVGAKSRPCAEICGGPYLRRQHRYQRCIRIIIDGARFMSYRAFAATSARSRALHNSASYV